MHPSPLDYHANCCDCNFISAHQIYGNHAIMQIWRNDTYYPPYDVKQNVILVAISLISLLPLVLMSHGSVIQ